VVNWSAASFADKNVGTGKAVALSGVTLNGADAANYSVATSGTTSADITARQVSVSGLSAANKTYDGTSTVSILDWGTAITGVNDETLALSRTGASFSQAGAGTGLTVTASGYALADGTHGGLASNYQLTSSTATTTADILRAPLSVIAHNDAKLVTQTDAAGYQGVTYMGFVNGEGAGVLGGALSVARSNAGVEGAGTYAGVLHASGLSASNYSIAYQAGNYTIVPAERLLVRVQPQQSVYGSAAGYAIASAEYLASDGSTIVTLSPTSLGANRFSLSDGAGGTASFTLDTTGAATSSAGHLVTGLHTMGATQVNQVGSNFSDQFVVVGQHTVTPKALTASASGGISKVYDGTTAMNGVTLSLAGLEAGDHVAVDGAGSFASRNAGNNVAYTISGLLLSGSDAANYQLPAGSSFTGTDGQITPRALQVGYTGVNKTYDGNTVATVTTSDNRIGGDTLVVTWGSASFADKNVGTGKTVTLSGVTLDGADAANYSVAASGTTSADITRRDTATWIGGSDGNWFDPANWADGAIPDLANVAHVIIPNGVTVRFDTTGAVAPAEASAPVVIDSLGQGGHLVQADGTLNVGPGGVRLDSLTQNGGRLDSQGGIDLGSFTQTGGDTRTDGDFTVSDGYSQGGSGSVSAGGNVSITDTTGGITLGNLQAGGDLHVVSTGGDVTQAAGTAIHASGQTHVNAGGSNILLNNGGNQFAGPFSASGHDIQVASNGVLTLGQVQASGQARFSGIVIDPVSSVLRAMPLAQPSLVLPVREAALATQVRTGSSERTADGIVVALLRVPTEGSEGQFNVWVPEEMAASGFQVALSPALTEGLVRETPITATLPNGAPLPAWLRFLPETRSFVASAMPPAALPLDVIVTIGAQRTRVRIIPGSLSRS
ncbi:YDG domain-containing protein, partial [Hydrogenophaga palleronii]|uniref:YDG domain-containing protein n=1 Tax=Hydrogenophaga palleronii TaxID=65655 RepID=UPI001FDFD6B1